MKPDLADCAESLLHSMIAGHIVNEYEAANVARVAWLLAEAFEGEREKRSQPEEPT